MASRDIMTLYDAMTSFPGSEEGVGGFATWLLLSVPFTATFWTAVTFCRAAAGL